MSRQLPYDANKKHVDYKERRLTCAVARFLNLVLLPPARFYHVPNGEDRKEETRKLLAGMGVKPGVFDIHIEWPGGHGYIELKAEQARKTKAPYRPGEKALSPEQKEFRDDCIALGIPWAVCHHTDEISQVLKDWGVPTRRYQLT